MAELWAPASAASRSTCVSAWKEVLVLVALVLVVRARGAAAVRRRRGGLARARVRALRRPLRAVPQSWLDGGATAKGVLYGAPPRRRARRRLLPRPRARSHRRELRRVVLHDRGDGGRGRRRSASRRLRVPLQWWRDSGAPGWFREQLGFVYRGLSGLPGELRLQHGRRAAAAAARLDVPVAARVVVPARRRAARSLRRGAARQPLASRVLWLWVALVALLFAGAAVDALALGVPRACARSRRLVRSRARRRRSARVGRRRGRGVAVGGSFVARSTRTSARRRRSRRASCSVQRANAAKEGAPTSGATDASTESHWRSLRDGVETVLRHPQGYGLGNAGSTAFTHRRRDQGRRVDLHRARRRDGLLGALVFVAWSVALAAGGCCTRSPSVAASLVAVLALGLQTDVIGVPWLAYVVWALAGSRA